MKRPIWLVNQIFKKRALLILSLATCVISLGNVSAGEAKYTHTPWSRVLEKFVNDQGLVDYIAVSKDREDLDRYVKIIEDSGPDSDPTLFPTPHHQLAYYINAYNALVFQGVLSWGPEQKSVWSGLISGFNFFVRMRVRLDGKTTNLRYLENKLIREKFSDPRIHAALNCASISCPRLIRLPYDPENLDNQLDRAMREFVSNENNVSVDQTKNRVFVSEIFQWFGDDFINFEIFQGNLESNLLDYINRYRESNALIDRNYKIEFIKYNKGINIQSS